jgi:perosamine synthetase
MGMYYALGCCNGAASLLAGMWACGVGAGDEIIAPSMTYWASAAPALMLGAANALPPHRPQAANGSTR